MNPFRVQRFNTASQKIRRAWDWFNLTGEEADIFLQHGGLGHEAAWEKVYEMRAVNKGNVLNLDAPTWRTSNVTGKPEWVYPDGRVTSIDPDAVAQQIKQKPIETAKDTHKVVKNLQSDVKIKGTTNLSQKDARKRNYDHGKSALEKNKYVVPEGKKWHPPLVHPSSANTIIGPLPSDRRQRQVTNPAIMERYKRQQEYKLRKELARSNAEWDVLARKNLREDTAKLLKYGKVFLKTPWVKKVAGIAISVTAFNMAASTINRFLGGHNNRALPDEYERGYDIITESITDFGSPLNLSKAAQKIITPYYSTVRKATYTTVNSVINSNAALALSKNAINHTRY